jgi:hypothetical protein
LHNASSNSNTFFLDLLRPNIFAPPSYSHKNEKEKGHVQAFCQPTPHRTPIDTTHMLFATFAFRTPTRTQPRGKIHQGFALVLAFICLFALLLLHILTLLAAGEIDKTLHIFKAFICSSSLQLESSKSKP